MKGRSGSAGPNINALGKALMANFTPSKNGARQLDSFADIFTSKDGSLIPNKHRAFLMDTQVKYTIVSMRMNYFTNRYFPSSKIPQILLEIFR